MPFLTFHKLTFPSFCCRGNMRTRIRYTKAHIRPTLCSGFRIENCVICFAIRKSTDRLHGLDTSSFSDATVKLLCLFLEFTRKILARGSKSQYIFMEKSECKVSRGPSCDRVGTRDLFYLTKVMNLAQLSMIFIVP